MTLVAFPFKILYCSPKCLPPFCFCCLLRVYGYYGDNILQILQCFKATKQMKHTQRGRVLIIPFKFYILCCAKHPSSSYSHPLPSFSIMLNFNLPLFFENTAPFRFSLPTAAVANCPLSCIKGRKGHLYCNQEPRTIGGITLSC